ncbi:hypothetical protein KUCAC02_025357, partial [Chaenocephalus aceratus]
RQISAQNIGATLGRCTDAGAAGSVTPGRAPAEKPWAETELQLVGPVSRRHHGDRSTWVFQSASCSAEPIDPSSHSGAKTRLIALCPGGNE